MRFRLIEDQRDVWPVRVMCDALGVSPSSYYAWRSRPESPRKIANRELLVDIRRVHTDHRGRYGAPRIHAELRAEGRTASRKRVERIMRRHGIRARVPRRYRVCTTDSKHSLPVAANLLDRNFVAEKPNQVWLADITYIPTGEGWLYLAVILDLFTRKVVAWAMREHMRAELTMAALTMAIQRRRPGPGLIHHSDRGSQGGFKGSSQHLDEGLRWALGSGARMGPGEVFCDRRVGQGWRGVRIGGGSGRRSRRAWRVRTPRAAGVCRRR